MEEVWTEEEKQRKKKKEKDSHHNDEKAAVLSDSGPHNSFRNQNHSPPSRGCVRKLDGTTNRWLFGSLQGERRAPKASSALNTVTRVIHQ
jgi:hypothetical protein